MPQIEGQNKFDHDRTKEGFSIWWLAVPIVLLVILFSALLLDWNTSVSVSSVMLNAPAVTLDTAQQAAVDNAIDATAAARATASTLAPWASVGQ